MQDLIRQIDSALRARGWSAREASMRAVGTPELIRDMRRGRVPSVERFRALCEVLDLEFYVGPHRDEQPVDTCRLEQALDAADRVLVTMERKMTRTEKSRVVSAIYDLIGTGTGNGDEGRGRTTNAARIVQLIDMVAKSRPRLDEPGT